MQEENLYNIFLELLRWNELSLAERLITANKEASPKPAYELSRLAYDILFPEDADVLLMDEIITSAKKNNSKDYIISVGILVNYNTFKQKKNKCYLEYSLKITDPYHIQNQLNILLDLVGWGKQDIAELILKANQDLANRKGNLTDCSGRTWKNITAYQYAILALDYHMWNMIKKYLKQEDAFKQIEEITEKAILNENEGWIINSNNFDWPAISWFPLINALQIYVANFNKWSYEQLVEHWLQLVGGAQLILPSHIINEYSHPTRSFFPCPKWEDHSNEVALPRTGVLYWRSSQNEEGKYILGNDFAWVRASFDTCTKIQREGKNMALIFNYAISDNIALRKLMRARITDIKILLQKNPKEFTFVKFQDNCRIT